MKKYLLTFIISILLFAKTHAANKVDYVLITLKDIKEIAKKKRYTYLDIENSLIQFGIIKNNNGCYYELDLPRLKEEQNNALSRGDEELVNLLKDITDNQTIITIVKPKNLKAAPQDFTSIICEEEATGAESE